MRNLRPHDLAAVMRYPHHVAELMTVCIHLVLIDLA